MTRQQRYQRVLDYYREAMPKVTTELQFGSAFQLLVATLLSAQCTDKRINQVTPALFSRYPTAQAMAQAEGLWAHALSVGMRRRLAEKGLEGYADADAACEGAHRVAWPEDLTAPGVPYLPGYSKQEA